MNIIKLIKISIISIFLLHLTVSVATGNANLSKKNIEYARSIFKQIEKGNWQNAIRKSKKINNKMLEQLVYWLYLNQKTNNANFNDYQNFIKQNPNLPKINRLKHFAEYKINIKSISPQLVINYFKIKEPSTSYGKIKLGEALIAVGSTLEGEKLIKTNWENANLTKSNLSYLLKNYKNIIKEKDIIDRAEWLAWENKSQQLANLFKYLPRDYKSLYEARYLLMIRLYGVDFAIKNVPNKYKNNQGLLYHRLRWKIKTEKIDSAINLLLRAKNNVENFNRPDKFWNPTSTIVRHLVYRKKYLSAYKIASQHYLKQGSKYAEAEWLSGWIALKFLNEPLRALDHFLNMAKRVHNPRSRSRAAYWCARAYELLNQPTQAKKWYTKGSAYLTTYHGQLSFHKIFPNKKTSLSDPPIISKITENNFNDNQWVQAVKILKAINRTYYSRDILEHLSTMDGKTENEFLAAQLAMNIGRTDYAIKIAKKASYQRRYYINFNYPTLKVPSLVAKKKMPPAELILAVIRQESEFNVSAESNKGAMGLMQIMPDTAREVAKKTRVWYNPGKLKRDQKYNINLGSYYLQMMLDKYRGSYPLALAAYNAGHKRVDRWLKINGDPRKKKIHYAEWIELIPFKETRNYVQRVLENVNVYRYATSDEPIKLYNFFEN